MSIDWNTVIQSIIASAITAVIFSGGMSYFLQKRNRRANILSEKGFELIDEIYSINKKRIDASIYLTIFDDAPKAEITKVYSDYVKSCLEFEIDVKKKSMFLNKKINRKLEEFISYLKEVEIALDKNLNGKGHRVTFTISRKEDELCNQIIRLIKKA